MATRALTPAWQPARSHLHGNPHAAPAWQPARTHLHGNPHAHTCMATPASLAPQAHHASLAPQAHCARHAPHLLHSHGCTPCTPSAPFTWLYTMHPMRPAARRAGGASEVRVLRRDGWHAASVHPHVHHYCHGVDARGWAGPPPPASPASAWLPGPRAPYPAGGCKPWCGWGKFCKRPSVRCGPPFAHPGAAATAYPGVGVPAVSLNVTATSATAAAAAASTVMEWYKGLPVAGAKETAFTWEDQRCWYGSEGSGMSAPVPERILCRFHCGVAG